MSVGTHEKIRKSNAIECWHFLKEDRRLQFEPRTLVKPGLKLTVKPPLRLRERGLHASVRPIDALQYASGPVICRVRIWGEVIRGDDKLCGQHREVLWMADASSTLHHFACDVATEALDLVASRGETIDSRLRKAIDVKFAWLRGEVTDMDLAAARAAVRAAVRAAAKGDRAADSIAIAAAWAAWASYAATGACAAASAAASGACAAASAAASGDCAAASAAASGDCAAVRAAARDKQNSRINDMFMQLWSSGD